MPPKTRVFSLPVKSFVMVLLMDGLLVGTPSQSRMTSLPPDTQTVNLIKG